ncbi:hypothetical protein BJF84_25280 [Rhodococcus sp. CUA-806]|nr:hypothetical protein BJF84_25280 [Rhodococcus sp. CUA-806]
MSEHLDPGYAAAASKKPRGGRPNKADIAVAVLGALLVGCVSGLRCLSWPRTTSMALVSEVTFSASVRAAQDRAAALDDNRRELAEDLEAIRAAALTDDAAGESVLTELSALEIAAGAATASGPGIVVTVAEPPTPVNLSDVSSPVRGSSEAAVLDRDLQVLVNSLWVSGAEAVTVDDVRIGPGVTIRQAGGSMLVDNRPVFAPYTVAAIGSPSQLQARFAVSDAYLRLSALAQLYQVGFDVRVADELDMPASVVRTIRSATPGGQP